MPHLRNIALLSLLVAAPAVAEEEVRLDIGLPQLLGIEASTRVSDHLSIGGGADFGFLNIDMSIDARADYGFYTPSVELALSLPAANYMHGPGLWLTIEPISFTFGRKVFAGFGLGFVVGLVPGANPCIDCGPDDYDWEVAHGGQNPGWLIPEGKLFAGVRF